jgi:hypothetical protein
VHGQAGAAGVVEPAGVHDHHLWMGVERCQRLGEHGAISRREEPRPVGRGDVGGHDRLGDHVVRLPRAAPGPHGGASQMTVDPAGTDG